MHPRSAAEPSSQCCSNAAVNRIKVSPDHATSETMNLPLDWLHARPSPPMSSPGFKYVSKGQRSASRYSLISKGRPICSVENVGLHQEPCSCPLGSMVNSAVSCVALGDTV